MAVEASCLDLDCHRCKDNPDLQRRRGCLHPTEFPQHVFMDGTRSHRCPGTFITPEIRCYIDLYSDYKKGWLPFPGVKQQQPAKLMKIFDLIDDHIARFKKHKDKTIEGIIKGKWPNEK